MSKADEAVQCFKNGYLCSQAVLSTYSEQLGLDRETALKLACPFGGGIARMGETCGAVTGAFMLIGLKAGMVDSHKPEDKEHTYQLVQEFTDRFTEMYGSIKCAELLHCDISTEKGRTFAIEHNLYDTLCPVYVCDAVKIVEDLLELKSIHKEDEEILP